MYRSDNDRSIKVEEHNLHKYNSESNIADNSLQYGMYRLMEVNVRPLKLFMYKFNNKHN